MDLLTAVVAIQDLRSAQCHVEEWLKFDALWLRTAATSETWFMSPAGAGLGSNPIRDYIFLATSEADPVID